MNAALNQLGSGLFGFFGQLSMELAALAVLVFLIGRVLPIKSPALRHFLWLVVLLKPLVAVAINSPWTVFTPLVELVEPGWSALDQAPLRGENLDATVAIPAATIGGKTVQLTRVGWVAGLWIVSAALILGRILIGYGIVWRLRRQAQVQRRGPLFNALWQARLALGLEASAEVATSCSIRSPIVLGILRPLIVIPADLVAKLRADELELVLMHELAHVRRYDNFTLLLQRLITVVLFFHPAVWLCGHLLRREAEQACDDLVVCSTGRSEEYARGLTNVAELAQLRNPLIRRIPIMNIFSATESDLALRIRRTLGGNAHRMGPRSRILAAVLLCAMAAATLPSSGIAQTRDRAAADSDRETRDDGVDWEAIRTTAPEEWSQELKDQLVAAGYDVEAIAERVRQGQAAARERPAGDSGRGSRDGAAVDLDAIGRKIREAIANGELTAEEGRAKMEAARQAAEGGADKRHEERIWQAAMATDPDEWSDRLKDALLALKPDSTIEEIAEAVRQRQQAARVWGAAMATDPDEWSEELKAAILELKPESTIEEIAEAVRQRQQAVRTEKDRAGLDLDAIGRRIRAAVEAGELTPEEGRARYEAARQALGERGEGGDDQLRKFQRGVIERAMAEAPEEWSDEMKAAIVRAGWDLDKFSEGIRQRQAAGTQVTDLSQILIDLTTSIEESSWGQIKKDVIEGE